MGDSSAIAVMILLSTCGRKTIKTHNIASQEALQDITYHNDFICQWFSNGFEEVSISCSRVGSDTTCHKSSHVIEEVCGSFQGQQENHSGPVENIMHSSSSKGSPENVSMNGLSQGNDEIGHCGSNVGAHNNWDGRLDF